MPVPYPRAFRRKPRATVPRGILAGVTEPLKDSFGPDVPRRLGQMLAAVHDGFPADAFVADALEGYDELELTPRARRIAAALSRHLPADFDRSAAIVEASLGPPIDGDELTGLGMAPFLYLPYVFWVAAEGIGHWERAMALQHELTQRMSCEFSIRAFIDAEPARTLARLREWTLDPSPHVRRLVSEGTRPRLPWAPRLRRFVDDPSPVLMLLELLKDDPTTLVRRSVANNLNDIGKDHPDVLFEVCRRWLVDAPAERRALVSHALRSAVKRGDPGALELLGFGEAAELEITAFTIDPMVLPIGGRVRISCTLMNRADVAASWNVDLRVRFVKANGSAAPKTFKVKTVELAPGAAVTLAKSVSVAQHNTRSHHPGEHRVELVVNGATHPLGSFTLLAG
jgi:3-methyladenine DNA glycosylase AlkC